MKVIKVNDQGDDFQPIDLTGVFAELKASVKEILGENIVKIHENLKIIQDSNIEENSYCEENSDREENSDSEESSDSKKNSDSVEEICETSECQKWCCLLQ